MKIEREKFLHILESVKPGLSPREIHEQSNCFVFKGGRVYTFNDEIACRSPSLLPEDFQGAVPAAKLIDVLSKIPDDELEFNSSDSRIDFWGKGKQRHLWCRLEHDIALPIGSIQIPKKPEEWKKLHTEFSEAVGVVGQCVAEDQTRFDMTCVHIHPQWVEAGSQHQFCRWAMKTQLTNPTLVRQTAINHIVPLGMMEFSETDSWLHFRNKNKLVISVRRYMEEFPKNFDKLLDLKGVEISLPKGLAEETELAGKFSAENIDNDKVWVELGSDGKVSVGGDGITGGYEGHKKLKYEGKSITFLISPKVLTELVKRYSSCQVASEKVTGPDGKLIVKRRLVVKGEKYTYVASLSKAKEATEKPKENESSDGE